jgi:hypothetical protein
MHLASAWQGIFRILVRLFAGNRMRSLQLVGLFRISHRISPVADNAATFVPKGEQLLVPFSDLTG